LFAQTLNTLKDEGNYPIFANRERHHGSSPKANNHGDKAHKVTVLCSNSDLGMGQHPDVIAAMHAALDTFDTGAGGTRNISGTTHHHVILEVEHADFHGKQSALLFTSGYVANWAALGTLAAKTLDYLVLSDALNHASMIVGIRCSKAERQI
jgi:5-aminolevulinate synthase